MTHVTTHIRRAICIDDATGRTLLGFARATIAEAMGGPAAQHPKGGDFDAPAATFVTLHRSGRLHGCIGSLEPRRTLASDVYGNTRAAAFEDPRCTPIALRDVVSMDVEISVLSPFTPITFDTEADAAAALRPGVDGVFLRWGAYRGTFLPQVWDDLPAAGEFLRQLKLKAGLRVDFWAPDVHLDRYTVQKFVDASHEHGPP